MTNREFYSAIIANESISADLREFAKAQIAKLDARNEKRANTLTKAQVANMGVKEQIVNYLTVAEKALAADIAKNCDISTQKVSALCRQLVENGTLVANEVKVKGKGMLKEYALA